MVSQKVVTPVKTGVQSFSGVNTSLSGIFSLPGVTVFERFRYHG